MRNIVENLQMFEARSDFNILRSEFENRVKNGYELYRVSHFGRFLLR